MNETELQTELLAWFEHGMEAPAEADRFNRLALEVFAHQFARNRPYSAFCRSRGAAPANITCWRDIPAVPTGAFKEADLTTCAPHEIQVTYRTSGTSRGGGKRGRHLLPDTTLYDASLIPNFRAHVLPDRTTIRVLAAGPTARFFPESSLGHMYSAILSRFGATGSGTFWRDDGPRFPCLAAALRKAETDTAPVLLLGTAFGFVLLMDWLEEQGLQFALPPGSRLVDTGGYKGRSREVPRNELYSLYGTRLGIPLTHVVNEYGMTELGSQFYDTILRDTLAGRSVRPRAKSIPPWVRVEIVDPETLEPAPEGQVGLIRIFDLANLHSVVAVQTDDLGRSLGDRFEVLGRAGGAEIRGCSLIAEEWSEQTMASENVRSYME